MIGPLRPIEAYDLDAVSKFILRAHKVEAGAFADTGILEWKYLRPRSDWTGSRGFVLEKHGRIVACGGIVPAVFRLPSGDAVQSATLIDWAAESAVPGAGVILLTRLLEKTDTLFIIGGTLPTRQILPKIGFRHAGFALAYARWVRPWREFWIRPRTFRSGMRLLHGAAHSLRPKRTFMEDWDSVSVDAFDHSLHPLLHTRPLSVTFCERTVENLNYMLQCPAVEMRGFLLRRKNSVVGYFVLGKVGWEGRIVDILVDSEEPRDWTLAYATATHAAMCEAEICRIHACATAPLFSEALLQNGFWLRRKDPIMIRDPKNLLRGAFPIDFQLFEWDAAYLTNVER